MKIGLDCPSFTWPGGDAVIGGRFAAAARGAEQAGLHSFWVMDHFWQIGHVGPPEDAMLEAYTALAYAAAVTERITVGALVTGACYREPGFLVKQVTTLDVLSGGRAVLGIGAGWNEAEARGLGLPFPPRSERFERLEETLQIALRMWSGDESAYEGRHYRLERPLNSPQALSKPHPPILIGGGGEQKTLKLVAQYADACNLLQHHDVRHKLAVLRNHCDAVGRDYGTIEKTLAITIPEGETTEETVRRCTDYAASGIQHVIVDVPDPASERWLEHLARVAAAVSEL